MSKLKVFVWLLALGGIIAALTWIKNNISASDLLIMFIVTISIVIMTISLYWAVDADGRILH